MITKSCTGCGAKKTDSLSRFRYKDWICIECFRNSTIGAAKLPEYNSWGSMKDRCLNPQSKSFYRYGGRGIEIHKEWKESFVSFYEYMGPRPTLKHTLERINNDGHYEPGNVRWATHKEQASNCSRNSFIEHNGERLTPMQWAERLNISRPTFMERLSKNLPPERLFAPKPTSGKGSVRLITFQNETLNLKQWAEKYKVDPQTLRRWLDDYSLTMEEIQTRL